MTRTMTVYYGGTDDRKPMIRIANSLLQKSGFEIGNKIDVTYKKNKITINKINNN